ncbi:MAG: AbrB/MazE/SpoVT family DNA-binding domain-containing protein [Promethearchaeota archaeon]
MTKVIKGKYFFGSVKVGERGQIVIPIEARKLFNIKPGDKLLVLGDEKKGIALAKASLLKNVAMKLFEVFGKEFDSEKE